MAITGVHALFYTPEAEELRSALREVFGWPQVDAGDGWPIFALPAAELAVHPAGEARHELAFMCDDLAATMGDLRASGVSFKGVPEEHTWGVSVVMALPGGVDVLLYEPRHPLANS